MRDAGCGVRSTNIRFNPGHFASTARLFLAYILLQQYTQYYASTRSDRENILKYLKYFFQHTCCIFPYFELETKKYNKSTRNEFHMFSSSYSCSTDIKRHTKVTQIMSNYCKMYVFSNNSFSKSLSRSRLLLRVFYMQSIFEKCLQNVKYT